jgi:transposase-like protein
VQQLRAFSKWKWHPDEVFLKVNGKRHYLSRAVGHEGKVLQAVVTKRRNKQAVLKFFKKLMKQPWLFRRDRNGSLRVVSGCSQRTRRYRKTADGQVVQQPRRELAPSFPTTRTRDAAFQAHAKSTEIRLCPFLLVQPIQPGKIASQPRHLPAAPLRHS